VLGKGLCNGTTSTFGACGLSGVKLDTASNEWKRQMEVIYTNDTCVNDFKRHKSVCAEIFGGRSSDICGDRAADYCKSMINTFQHECVKDADCGVLTINANVKKKLLKTLCCSLLKREYESIICEGASITLLNDWIEGLKIDDPPQCNETVCYAGALILGRSYFAQIVAVIVALGLGSGLAC